VGGTFYWSGVNAEAGAGVGWGWGVGEGNQMMGKRRLVDSLPLFATKEVPLGSQLW
jgi:hypothetical protein